MQQTEQQLTTEQAAAALQMSVGHFRETVLPKLKEMGGVWRPNGTGHYRISAEVIERYKKRNAVKQ